MGLLDSLMTNYGGQPGAQFPAPPPSPEEIADQARQVAAGRVSRSAKRRGAPEDGSTIAGMLNALPFSVPGASPWGNAAQAAEAPGAGGASGVDESGLSQAYPDVPLPRPRPAGLDAMASGNVPVPAPQPVAPAPAGAPPAPSRGGFVNGLSNVLARNPSMLMAMGAGMMGAPSLGQGMSRGFAAAVPAAAQDTAQGLKTQGISESYKALVKMGFSPQEALAAVYQPDMMKALIARAYPKFGDIQTNVYGQPVKGFINERTQTVSPATMAPPANIASQPIGFQMQVAPEGTTARTGDGKNIVKRGSKWVYTDDGKPFEGGP